MKNKRLPKVSDENTIVITAQFYEAGKRLTSDRNQVHCCEMDLVVPWDTTLNELLGAIGEGIQQHLRTDFQIDPQTTDYSPIYMAEKERYAEQVHLAQEAGIIRQRKERKPIVRRDSAVQRDLEQDRVVYPSAVKLSGDDLRLRHWLVCWHVYQECRAQYDRGYPERLYSGIRKSLHIDAYPAHPVIACGGVSLRSWEDGSLLAMGKMSQIWLQNDRDGARTLRDLGFLSSSRLIFDPIDHHSGGALIDEREFPGELADKFPHYSKSHEENIEFREKSISIRNLEEVPAYQNNRLPEGLPAFLAALLVLGLGLWSGMELLPGLLPDPINGQVWVWCLTCLAVVPLSLWVFRSIRNGAFLHRGEQTLRAYEAYITELIHKINTMQKKKAIVLAQTYPPVFDPAEHDDLIEDITHLRAPFFSRGPDRDDFLHVRLGLSGTNSVLVPSPVSVSAVPQANAGFSGYRYCNIRNLQGYPFRILSPGTEDAKQLSHDGSTGYLDELPEHLSEEYAYLDNAPVLMDLKRERLIGLLCEDRKLDLMPILSNLILDLCCHHSPEDLQMVVFCPDDIPTEGRMNYIRRFRHLPHFNGLLGDVSAFVFDRDHAVTVMDRLMRFAAGYDSPVQEERSHVVLIMLSDYGLRMHPLATLLPGSSQEIFPADNQISFLYGTYFEQQLPPFCGHVLKIDQKRRFYYLPYPHRVRLTEHHIDLRVDSQYQFEPDEVVPEVSNAIRESNRDRFYRSFKILSALTVNRIGQKSIPARGDLLSLYQRTQLARRMGLHFVCSGGKLPSRWQLRLAARLRRYVNRCWSHSVEGTYLETPIGMDRSGVYSLDLTSGGHGPNLLVSSAPGMGKSTTLLTVLTGLAIHHPPEKVRMVLVDHQSFGLCSKLGGLPHLVKMVGGGDQRALTAGMNDLITAMRQLMSRRLDQFARLNVRCFADYEQAWLRIDDHLEKQLGLLPGRDDREIAGIKQMGPMPHIVIAIDHFEDLSILLSRSGQQYDLNRELISLAGSAERFGLHIVLASDAGTNVIPDSLLREFQSRICLKTDDPQMSRRLLGSALAASGYMEAEGGAYLHTVSTGHTEYLRIACGFDAAVACVTVPLRITRIKLGGINELFYDAEGDYSSFYTDEQPWLFGSEEKYQHSKARKDAGFGNQNKGNWESNGNPQNSGGDREYNNGTRDYSGDREYRSGTRNHGGDREYSNGTRDYSGDQEYGSGTRDYGGDQEYGSDSRSFGGNYAYVNHVASGEERGTASSAPRKHAEAVEDDSMRSTVKQPDRRPKTTETEFLKKVAVSCYRVSGKISVI